MIQGENNNFLNEGSYDALRYAKIYGWNNYGVQLIGSLSYRALKLHDYTIYAQYINVKLIVC